MTKLETPISVVVPCYRCGNLLRDAIDSITNQGYTQLQVIVVNQGDDPETEASVTAVAEHPVVEVVTCAKKNAARARNVGLHHARGDQIAFLDSDDVWGKSMLKLLIEASGRPGVDCVFGETYLVDRNLEQLGTSVSSGLQFATFFDFVRCPIHINSILIDRRVLSDVTGFDEDLKGGEDWDFLQRIARTGRVWIRAPGAYAYYRMHSDNTTSDYSGYTKKLIDGVGRRIFSNDSLCRAAAPEFKNGVGSAQYELEQFSRQVQIACWRILQGHNVQPLDVLPAIFLHWYRQENLLESVLRSTLVRFYQKRLPTLRSKASRQSSEFVALFENLAADNIMPEFRLVSVEKRVSQALEPDLHRDLRLVSSYLIKGYRKYVQPRGFR